MSIQIGIDGNEYYEPVRTKAYEDFNIDKLNQYHLLLENRGDIYPVTLMNIILQPYF